MLHCAVPGCNVQEKYLRAGSLHTVDLLVEGKVTPRIVWFCHDCSASHTAQTWRPAGEQIQSRLRPRYVSPGLDLPAVVIPVGAGTTLAVIGQAANMQSVAA